jgi:hypothetical protein
MGRIHATIFHDEGNLSLLSSTRRKFFYGKAFDNYLRTNPRMVVKQVNPLRGIIVPSLRVFRSTPRYGIGILIMKALEWAAAALGYLVHY